MIVQSADERTTSALWYPSVRGELHTYLHRRSSRACHSCLTCPRMYMLPSPKALVTIISSPVISCIRNLDSFVTIGPAVLLCILSFTFHIGSRRCPSGQDRRCHPSSDASEISDSEQPRIRTLPAFPTDTTSGNTGQRAKVFGGVRKSGGIRSVDGPVTRIEQMAGGGGLKPALERATVVIERSKRSRRTPSAVHQTRDLKQPQRSRQKIWQTGPGQGSNVQQVWNSTSLSFYISERQSVLRITNSSLS